MSYNQNEADKNLSYMDGIPVKISEKYKPPKKITLPVGVLNRHGNENFEEYDFRLEKSMARKMVEWRELRKANAERRKQRLEVEDQRLGGAKNESVSTAAAEGVARLRVQSPEPPPTSSSAATRLQPDRSQPSLNRHGGIRPAADTSPSSVSSFQMPPTAGNDPPTILTPVRVNKPSATFATDRSVNPSFNISDFEPDTSSPFDNMELKTLNDIEELAHVLQPHFTMNNNSNNLARNNHPAGPDNVAHTTSPSECSVSGGSVNPHRVPPSEEKTNSYLPRVNGMLYNMYNNSTGLWQQHQQTNHHQHHQTPYVASAHSNVHSSSYNIGVRSWMQPLVSSYNSPNVQSYVVQRVESADDTSAPQSTTGPSSKSVPDIIQELESELKDKRDADIRRNAQISDQPARPASIGPTEVELVKQKSFSSGAPQSALPNPVRQLTPSCQQLSVRIAEMGFPLGRVARAVQRFGDNESRVLEFLLQIQNFEENGCPADRAEQALVANKYNVSETVRYLEMVKQLLDLGFVENKVTEALAKHSNDRDKALDSLIT